MVKGLGVRVRYAEELLAEIGETLQQHLESGRTNQLLKETHGKWPHESTFGRIEVGDPPDHASGLRLLAKV